MSGTEAGVIKQVNEVSSPTPDVAKPPVPVNVVNATVPPGMTVLDCAVATGAAGAVTVGVIVASSVRPVVSATMYFTAEAAPLKVGNGSKVTVPFALTVYVPSLTTVKVDKSQLAFAVAVVAQSFTLVAANVAPEPGVSFVKIVIV